MTHGPAARGRTAFLLGLAWTLGASLLTAPPAQADQRQIDQVEARIAELQEQAEAAAEDHHEARERLRSVERDIRTISQRLTSTQERLDSVTASINTMAATTWRTGGMDPSLQLLLADDADAFLATASALDQVARQQNAALRKTTTLRLTLREDRVQLASRRAEAAQAVKEMAEHKARVTARLAEANRVLSSLKAFQRRAYEARQRAKREAAAVAARRAKGTVAVSGPASARVKKVLSYALAQVGDRYVFAAEGDESFDCSGLVTAAYRRAGISLPHSSRAQYARTKRVSRSQLRPGDLVFFFRRGAAHVGIYIGGNRFVHASNPREDVIITSLSNPWYVARYSGAGRVVG